MTREEISVRITAGIVICLPQSSLRFLVPNGTSWGGSGREIKSRKWSTYAASILLLKMGCSMTDLPFPLGRVLSSLLIKPFEKAGYHLLEFDATKIVCAVANLISCPGEMTPSAVVIASLAFLRQYRCWVFKLLCSPGGVERGKQWLCCSQLH